MEVVAALRGVEPASLAKQVYENTLHLFKFWNYLFIFGVFN